MSLALSQNQNSLDSLGKVNESEDEDIDDLSSKMKGEIRIDS